MSLLMEMSKKTAAIRGLKQSCPRCDSAPLFRAYLKPVESCTSCGHDWSKVRADDGPAWATMLVVLHMLAPLFHYLTFKTGLPNWANVSILGGLAVILCLLLLPRMKGLFIGLIWATGAPTS